jgi:hypothetical protein
MLIATFGPSTGWAGKAITRGGDVFTLEGHGSITAADVMEYDRQGPFRGASTQVAHARICSGKCPGWVAVAASYRLLK